MKIVIFMNSNFFCVKSSYRQFTNIGLYSAWQMRSFVLKSLLKKIIAHFWTMLALDLVWTSKYDNNKSKICVICTVSHTCMKNYTKYRMKACPYIFSKIGGLFSAWIDRKSSPIITLFTLSFWIAVCTSGIHGDYLSNLEVETNLLLK